jgi:hypothetical protein
MSGRPTRSFCFIWIGYQWSINSNSPLTAQRFWGAALFCQAL